MTKQARILDDRRLKQALAMCRLARERAMFLLSVKAGLRAVEIAGLSWDRIDFDGNYLLLKTTKGDKPRHVPLNKELAPALLEYREERSSKAKGPVFVNTNADKGAPLTAGAVAVWFHDFYGKRLGWEGHSSHSGRRTFVTNAARKVSLAGERVEQLLLPTLQSSHHRPPSVAHALSSNGITVREYAQR